MDRMMDESTVRVLRIRTLGQRPVISEIRLQWVFELVQSRNQGLEGEISRSVGGVHARHVLKLTGLADVTLGR